MLVIWYKIHCAGVLWHVGGPFSVWKALLSLWNWTPGGGRLWGCRRGGVGHFKAVTYLWNNPQSFKLNLLLISCSSYLSQQTYGGCVYGPPIGQSVVLGERWLAGLYVSSGSERTPRSEQRAYRDKVIELELQQLKFRFTQRHQQRDGLQQLQQEQNPQRPGAHGPNWMWVFPPLKHLKQVWGKLERRELTSLG